MNHLEQAAVKISAYATWKSLRRTRRRKVEHMQRFRFTERQRPPQLRSPEEAVAQLYAGREHLLEPAELPAHPPSPEEEAKGADGGQPPVLPLSREWWYKERQRQVEQPFKAGKVATASLNFRPGLRPMPPPGMMFSWGPEMRFGEMGEEDREAVLKILAKDLRAKGCEACRWEDVDVLTPVHLVRHPVTGKPRLTHDERAINVRLEDSTAEMAKAEDALLRGSVAAKLDLLMAFRHVAWTERDKRVMGFVVEGVVFRWAALPFGCGQSPEFFSKALASSIRTITMPGGATLVVYVDDILIVASDLETLDKAMVHLCQGLANAGWYVALDKIFPYAMTVVPFLGLLVDLQSNKLRVSKAKAQRVQDLCQKALDKSKVTLRDLQRIGGLLAFLAKAAPEAGLCRHGINAATAEAEGLPGRTVSIKGQLRDDLVFWRRNAEHLPSMSHLDADGDALAVATDAAGLPSLAFAGVVWNGAAPTPDIEEAMGEVADWARNRRSGVTVGGGEVYAGPFAEAVASLSSSALETRTLTTVLKQYVAKHGPDSLRGRVVKWYSDSAVAVGAVSRWRAKAAGLVGEVTALLAVARKYGFRLEPHWVSREAGWQPVTDALSKVAWQRDTAEWHFEKEAMREVCNSVTEGAWSTPDIDLFATKGNQLAPRFVSLWPELGNDWTGAFTRPWAGLRRAWAFPPFSVALAALRHACRGSMDVVIVIPRSTVVPARLRVCPRIRLEPPHLRDASGHRPPQPCPIPLDAVWVHRTAG